MNLGTVPARSKITLEYDVVVDSGVESVPAPGPTASFSSREIGVLVKANTSNRWTWPSWRASSARSRMLPEQSHCRSWISTRARSRPGAKRPPEAVRVFGLDSRYLEGDLSIRIVNGSYEPGSGLPCAEAALALSVGPGAVVQVRVPGRSQPIGVRISGITDVSQAKSSSTAGRKAVEQFVYVETQ